MISEDILRTRSPDFYLGYKTGYEAAQPKWIGVEQRLPEDDAYYLVYLKGYCENRVARYDGDGEWADQYDDHDITRFVTHWMPLPQAPEVEKDD